MRTYTITHPDAKSVRYQCDRTVQRFRSLPVGSLFLIGEQAEVVYEKTGKLEVTLACATDGVPAPALRAAAAMNDNPWCEPLIEVKA